MPKYRITNISHTHEDGPKNFFLTEAGKLIKPGEHCVCNRLDSGTQHQVDAKLLRKEEGSFDLPSIFDEKEKPEVPAVNPEVLAAEAKAKEEADAKADAEAAAKAEAAKADAEAAAKAEAEAAQAQADADAAAQAEGEAAAAAASSDASGKEKSKKRGNR